MKRPMKNGEAEVWSKKVKKFFKRIFFTLLFKILRRTYARKVAKELVGVQPMRNFTKEQIKLFFYSDLSMGEILYLALGVPKDVVKKIHEIQVLLQ